MAINLRCSRCKAERKLGTKTCKCGNNLKKNAKFKVLVKLSSGKTLTRIVSTLPEAQAVELEFMNGSPAPSLANEPGPALVLAAAPAAAPVIPSQPTPQAPLIQEAWNQFMEWAEANKPGSWKDDNNRWNFYVRPHFEGKRMDEVGVLDVEAILNKLRQSKTRFGKPYAPASLVQVVAVIRRLYNWSIKRKLYKGENPASAVELPKIDNKVTNFLHEPELERLVSTCETWDNRRAALAVLFALFTGKRRGEMLKLTWQQVDFEARTITLVSENTKNRRTAILPISDVALDVLRKAQEVAVPDSPYVFAAESGKYYSGFNCIWKRVKKRAGLPENFRFHDLRHTFATYLANSGEVDIFLLQSLLGHESVKMTQRYSHILNKSLRRGADVAGRILAKGRYGDNKEDAEA